MKLQLPPRGTIHQTRNLRVDEDEHGFRVSVVLHRGQGAEYTDGDSRLTRAAACALLRRNAAALRARADELDDVADRLLREERAP